MSDHRDFRFHTSNSDDYYWSLLDRVSFLNLPLSTILASISVVLFSALILLPNWTNASLPRSLERLFSLDYLTKDSKERGKNYVEPLSEIVERAVHSLQNLMASLFRLRRNALPRAERIMRRLSNPSPYMLNTYRRPMRPTGLGNFDNSCYQNSILQGLASLDILPPFLDRVAGTLNRPEITTAALTDLIRELKNSEKSVTWTPGILKSMSSWNQQDAQEYFIKVLDELEKEATKCWELEKRSRCLQDFTMILPTATAQSAGSRISKATPLKAPSFPLEGTTSQSTRCLSCGYSEGITTTPFTALTLPIPDTHPYCDLASCLDEFTKSEDISGVNCENCTLKRLQDTWRNVMSQIKDDDLRKTEQAKLREYEKVIDTGGTPEECIAALRKFGLPILKLKQVTKTKELKIAKAPEALVLHFNRSIFDMYGNIRKNSTPVSFDRTLDLQPWTLDTRVEQTEGSEDEPQFRQDHLIYNLKAVITHQGHHHNGHYIAYRQHISGEEKSSWWRFSDDTVTPVDEEVALAQQGVFMLFYEKCADLDDISYQNAEKFKAEESEQSKPIKVKEQAEDIPEGGEAPTNEEPASKEDGEETKIEGGEIPNAQTSEAVPTAESGS